MTLVLGRYEEGEELACIKMKFTEPHEKRRNSLKRSSNAGLVNIKEQQKERKFY